MFPEHNGSRNNCAPGQMGAKLRIMSNWAPDTCAQYKLALCKWATKISIWTMGYERDISICSGTFRLRIISYSLDLIRCLIQNRKRFLYQPVVNAFFLSPSLFKNYNASPKTITFEYDSVTKTNAEDCLYRTRFLIVPGL